MDSIFMNQSRAARFLGVSPSHLNRLASGRGGLYAPACRHGRLALYHARQVALIARVWVGGDAALAEAEWALARDLLQTGGSTCAETRTGRRP